LCPKGFLKRDEEGGADAVPEEDAEFVAPLANNMLDMSSWTHMADHILRHGRTTHMEPPDEDPDDETVNDQRRRMLLEQETDPQRDLIRGLENDSLTWTIKLAGDTALYQPPPIPSGEEGVPPTKPPPTCNAAVFIRSLTWPGAVCAMRGGRFVNLYVGYGLPAGEPDFFFPAPLDIQDEPADIEEQTEPQGKKEEEKAEGEGDE